jgi:hypothetical protein
MPPKKRPKLSRESARTASKQKATVRANEDAQHRDKRQAADNARHTASRDTEDTVHQHERLAADSARHAASRAFQHRDEQLAADRMRKAAACAHGSNKAQHSIDDYVVGKATPPDPLDIGKMSVSCSKCHAKMWAKEVHSGPIKKSRAMFSTCCSQGKVQLPDLAQPPDVIKCLLTQPGREATHFRNNIRAYNSSLAFTSLGVKEQHLKGKGPPTFRIQGSVYHRTGQLLPEEGKAPMFSQMLIYDVKNELANRMKWNDSIQENILQQLQSVLHDVNPYIKEYVAVYSVAA